MYKNQNRIIFFLTVTIIAISLLALYSITYQREALFKSIFLGQLFRAIVGIIILFLVSNLNYRRFYDFAFIIYAVSILLLIVVLMPAE